MKPLHIILAATFLLGPGCSDDDAVTLGVGAACSMDSHCNRDDGQKCLLQFKGGYCGSTGCTSSADCSKGSLCVTHSDGKNYCFLSCTDKTQCNENRAVEVEANCSSNVTFASGSKEGKACLPPVGSPPADASVSG